MRLFFTHSYLFATMNDDLKTISSRNLKKASAADELFRTVVDTPRAPFRIEPTGQILCVGSCFADRISQCLADDHFSVTANPQGVMYNPASVLHTIERLSAEQSGLDGQGGRGFSTAILTFGTNHVYVEKSTGVIVDNCQKRPQQLFEERELSVEECAGYMQRSIELLRQLNPAVHIILTVSPIRYRKYGYHESQLSKATLLLSVDEIAKYQGNKVTEYQGNKVTECQGNNVTFYFPAYEILLDELRDYRFYASDMLHPSDQAVNYIYRRFQETFFSAEACQYVAEWRPIRDALAHRPFDENSADYQSFAAQTQDRLQAFEAKWKLK